MATYKICTGLVINGNDHEEKFVEVIGTSAGDGQVEGSLVIMDGPTNVKAVFSKNNWNYFIKEGDGG